MAGVGRSLQFPAKTRRSRHHPIFFCNRCWQVFAGVGSSLQVLAGVGSSLQVFAGLCRSLQVFAVSRLPPKPAHRALQRPLQRAAKSCNDLRLQSPAKCCKALQSTAKSSKTCKALPSPSRAAKHFSKHFQNTQALQSLKLATQFRDIPSSQLASEQDESLQQQQRDKRQRCLGHCRGKPMGVARRADVATGRGEKAHRSTAVANS